MKLRYVLLILLVFGVGFAAGQGVYRSGVDAFLRTPDEEARWLQPV